MTLRAVLLASALSVFLGVVPGPEPALADEKPQAAPASADFSGRWIYNRELSDNAREKMRQSGERGGGPEGGRPGGHGGGGMGGPGGGGGRDGSGGGMGRGGGGMGPQSGMGGGDAREAMQAVFEPAEELAIVQGAGEIAVDEKFGRTRRLHPDGKKYKTDNGVSEVKTSWKEGKLVVETRRDRGGAVVETWELVPDGSRVIVNVKLEGVFGPSVALKRIYDRAKEGRPSP